MERPNAANPTWAPLKLYLKKQVEEWSYARYGGPDGLRIERGRRIDVNETRRKRRSERRKRNRNEEDDSKYELNTLKMGRSIFLRHVSSSSDEDAANDPQPSGQADVVKQAPNAP